MASRGSAAVTDRWHRAAVQLWPSALLGGACVHRAQQGCLSLLHPPQLLPTSPSAACRLPATVAVALPGRRLPLLPGPAAQLGRAGAAGRVRQTLQGEPCAAMASCFGGLRGLPCSPEEQDCRQSAGAAASFLRHRKAAEPSSTVAWPSTPCRLGRLSASCITTHSTPPLCHVLAAASGVRGAAAGHAGHCLCHLQVRPVSGGVQTAWLAAVGCSPAARVL